MWLKQKEFNSLCSRAELLQHNLQSQAQRRFLLCSHTQDLDWISSPCFHQCTHHLWLVIAGHRDPSWSEDWLKGRIPCWNLLLLHPYSSMCTEYLIQTQIQIAVYELKKSNVLQGKKSPSSKSVWDNACGASSSSFHYPVCHNHSDDCL